MLTLVFQTRSLMAGRPLLSHYQDMSQHRHAISIIHVMQRNLWCEYCFNCNVSQCVFYKKMEERIFYGQASCMDLPISMTSILWKRAKYLINWWMIGKIRKKIEISICICWATLLQEFRNLSITGISNLKQSEVSYFSQWGGPFPEILTKVACRNSIFGPCQ